MELELEELTDDDFPTVRDWLDPGVFKIFSSPVDDTQLMRLLSAYRDGLQTDIGMKAVDSDTGDIVGLIHAVINTPGDYIHLQQIVVNPAMRNQGYGTYMIRLFLDTCFCNRETNRIQLFTGEENYAAIACYLKVGFRREKDRYQRELVFSIRESDWEKRTGA